MRKRSDEMQRQVDLSNQIEYVLDQCKDTAEFFDLMAEVFSAKADHLQENWQNDFSAEVYNRYAAYLLEACSTVEESFQRVPGQSGDAWSGGFADNH